MGPNRLPSPLGRVDVPWPTRERLLLDLERWLELRFVNKMLGKQEPLFLPIQAYIRDERAELISFPLLNLDPDPSPVTWWEGPSQRQAFSHADRERRRRPIVD